MQQLKIALHGYCLSSRDESLILAQTEFMNIPELLISRLSILDYRSSTLDSRVSKLERLDVGDARIEFRESSRDCQLTIERYCIYKQFQHKNLYNPLVHKIESSCR